MTAPISDRAGESVADVVVVLPPVDDGIISSGLYELSKALGTMSPEDQAHGFLGGEWGYGQDFSNDVFMMHPFCWCEQDDCEWCAGCDCPDVAWHYFVDDEEVTYDEWAAFYQRQVGDPPDWMSDDWTAHIARADAANARRKTAHDPMCRVCKGEWGNAPNFKHHESGIEVRWYKYIGRSMEVSEPVDSGRWLAILGECMASLSGRRAQAGTDG